MKTILFITDLAVNTRVEMLAGIRDAVSAESLHVEVVETTRMTQPLSEVVDFWHPTGCIVDHADQKTFSPIKSRGIPFVLVDPDEKALADPTMFTVTSSADEIAGLAVKELSSTECVSYAYAGWMDRAEWSRRRSESFRARLAKLGKECRLFDGSASKGSQQRYAHAVRTFLASLKTPCGIFAANDQVASIVLDQCALAGFCVPGDFFVVGVDDNPTFCDNLRPSLSSVRPGFMQAGYHAMLLLAQIIANPLLNAEKATYHPLGLTSRLSSRRIAAKSQRVLAALDLIRREACNGLKAAEVVHAMGVSERMAEIEFKKTTSRHITQEITEVRLEHVLELLSRPRQEIGPIANLCGWDSDIYLKRLFKKRFGMTMREWRKANTSR